jgi:hypothetical protein
MSFVLEGEQPAKSLTRVSAAKLDLLDRRPNKSSARGRRALR